MGKREAFHHFCVGAAGPESALIQELTNGDFPRRLAAEVRCSRILGRGWISEGALGVNGSSASFLSIRQPP
jgi:hypothetical protein